MEDSLKFLEKFYLSVTNDKKVLKSFVQNNELMPLSVEVQEKLLAITINNPLVEKYPPPISYQKFFLRTVLDAVENSTSEVSDSLIEAYANILSQNSQSTDIIYRTYKLKDHIITLQESSCFVANNTTGLQTWEASKYLLEWCLENASQFQDKKILELGSGIGLLGIAVLKLCQPLKYLFTDKSCDVLEMLSKNIAINFQESSIRDKVETHQLLWGETNCDDAKCLEADFLLGADIVFDPSIIPMLVETIKQFLIRKGTKCAYIASTIRNLDTNDFFTSYLDSAGLKYKILDFNKNCIFIYNESSKFLLYRICL